MCFFFCFPSFQNELLTENVDILCADGCIFLSIHVHAFFFFAQIYRVCLFCNCFCCKQNKNKTKNKLKATSNQTVLDLCATPTRNPISLRPHLHIAAVDRVDDNIAHHHHHHHLLLHLPYQALPPTAAATMTMSQSTRRFGRRQ